MKDLIKIADGIYRHGHPYKGNCYLVDGDVKILVDAGSQIPTNIHLIVLTHCHYDHITHVNALKAKHGCKIAASHETARFLRMNHPAVLREVEPIEVDVILKEGAWIENDKFKFKVLETPGHTSGCISLWEPEKKILFSGDCWFGSYGDGRSDLPSGDEKALLNSVRKLKALKPKLLCPGHFMHQIF